MDERHPIDSFSHSVTHVQRLRNFQKLSSLYISNSFAYSKFVEGILLCVLYVKGPRRPWKRPQIKLFAEVKPWNHIGGGGGGGGGGGVFVSSREVICVRLISRPMTRFLPVSAYITMSLSIRTNHNKKVIHFM